MVSVDSFSRRHFYRKLPNTVQFLDNLKAKGEYAIFDNKLHNIIGDDTLENMSHIFGTGFTGFHNPDEDDLFGEKAIWNVLNRMGFTTMMGFDGCAYKARRIMGSHPGVDHMSETFFCAAWKFARYRSSKTGTKQQQRCIADKMSHWYLMNYTLAFSDHYNNTNQWILGHYTAAHEETGQHAGTIDDDLVWYLD
jgi:hypothetical protein